MTINENKNKQNKRKFNISIGMLFGLSNLVQVSLLEIPILMCHIRISVREFITFLSFICNNQNIFSLTICRN
jgi:hypothetical protein